MAGNIETLPRIVYDGDDVIGQNLAFFDKEIHSNPQAFVQTLKFLGDVAITTTEIPRVEDLEPFSDREPAEIIEEYFGKRYDRHAEFDADTEAAIAQDPKMKELFAQKSNQPEEREANQRSIRLHRFGLYLGRVASYSEMSTPATVVSMNTAVETPLPKTKRSRSAKRLAGAA